MKSQVMKIRNIPVSDKPVHTIRIKPIPFLAGMMVVGIAVLMVGGFLRILGTGMTMIGIFALLVMPDWLLVNAHSDFMVLFNQRDRSSCMLVYWDEIVNWQYEYHRPADRLVILLVDGSTQMIELYGKRRIASILNEFCPGKEVKINRKRREMHEAG